MDIKLLSYDGLNEIPFDKENFVLNQKDLGAIPITVNSSQRLNQFGSFTTSKVIGNRDISIVGYILADDYDEMLEKKRLLQLVVGIEDDFYIIINDEYKLQVSSKGIEYGVDSYLNSDILCKFNITGTATNPVFVQNNPVDEDIAVWNKALYFPIGAVKSTEPVLFAVKSETLMQSINYSGEAEVGFITTFKATGTVKNPYIQNIYTGEKITVNTTMSANDVLVINTKFGEKTITLNGVNKLSLMDLDSDFIQLHIGENNIRFGAESGEEALQINISYEPVYLEV